MANKKDSKQKTETETPLPKTVAFSKFGGSPFSGIKSSGVKSQYKPMPVRITQHKG